jgi:ribosomal protein L5
VIPRLKQEYRDRVRDELREQLALGNVMQIPTLAQDRDQHGGG